MNSKKESPLDIVNRARTNTYTLAHTMIGSINSKDAEEYRFSLLPSIEVAFLMLSKLASHPDISIPINMTSLSVEQVSEVKVLLWNGNSQAEIAAAFGTSQGTVSRIATGYAAAAVPWPDGSLGPLPRYRKMELRRSNLLPMQTKHVDTPAWEPPVDPDVAERARKADEILEAEHNAAVRRIARGEIE